MLRTHRESGADATVAVIPVAEDQTSAFGILKMDGTGRIVHFDEKPPRERLPGAGVGAARAAARGYLASMGIYVFRREVLEQRGREPAAGRLRPPRHPRRGAAPARAGVRLPRLLGGRRDHPVLLPGQPGAVRADPAVRFLRRRRTPSTPTRASCPRRSWRAATSAAPSSPRGASCRRRDRPRRHRHPQPHRREASRIRNSLLLGADYYETARRDARDRARAACRPSASAPDTVIENAIVDKNARIGRGVRIVNEAGRQGARRRRLLHPRGHRRRARRTASSRTARVI